MYEPPMGQGVRNQLYYEVNTNEDRVALRLQRGNRELAFATDRITATTLAIDLLQAVNHLPARSTQPEG